MESKSDYKLEIIDDLIRQSNPDRRRLAPNEIVVAMARPAEVAEFDRRSTLMALLSDDEIERLKRFRFERDRDLFLVAHGLVRITLSRHENVEPQAWRFRTNSYGRPEIVEPRSRQRFSLSHGHGLAACAVVLDRDIGLDLECISKYPPVEVAERFFSEQERLNLQSASVDERGRLFLEYWTLKEAYLKARGLGLSFPLNQFSMHAGADGRWRMASGPPLYQDPERWRFWSWCVADDHQVALALDQAGFTERTS